MARPEFLYRPAQIFARLKYAVAPPAGDCIITMPWRHALAVDAGELHGRALLTHGVVDLALTEIIWRLLDEGDVAVDIGANIGSLTSAMVRRVGCRGTVIAFEPHPMTRARLSGNVERWQAKGSASVIVREEAVSSHVGKAFLSEPKGFQANSGLARIDQNSDGMEVKTITFDQAFAAFATVNLVKIDVEGNEAQVLAGMNSSLQHGKIQHLIFEDFDSLPSAKCIALEALGYTTFLIRRTIRGPALVATHEQPSATPGDPPNVFATLHPEIAQEKLVRKGYSCLRAGRASIVHTKKIIGKIACVRN